jgi:hypothetical protein
VKSRQDQQTFKLKDVSHVYTAHNVFTQFGNRTPAYGQVVISNEVVNVLGEHPLALPRDELIGLTPSGGRTGAARLGGQRHTWVEYAVGQPTPNYL